MLTPERMAELHAAYANDREPGAFERVLVRVWNECAEACADRIEAIRTRTSDSVGDAMLKVENDLHAGACRALKVEP